MRIAFTLVTFFLAAVVHRPATADVMMTHCACTSDAQWEAAAARSGQGVTGYLYSFQGRQVRKFRNSGMMPGTGADRHMQAPVQPTVQWLVVEPAYQQQFDDMLLVRDYFGKPISKILIPYPIPGGATNTFGASVGSYDAYTVMSGSAYGNHLAMHLREQRASVLSAVPDAGVVDALLRLLQQPMIKALPDGELLKLTYEVVFKDGSRVAYEDTGDGTPTRVAGSSWDRNLNTIPEGPVGPGTGGNYDIHDDDLGNWIRHMQSMGVQLTSGSRGGSSMIYCAWDGQALTCRLPGMAG